VSSGRPSAAPAGSFGTDTGKANGAAPHYRAFLMGVSVPYKLAAVPVRSGPSARVAVGALGLAVLFSIGYQISLRRLRRLGREPQ
jgi:hypothetical protein